MNVDCRRRLHGCFKDDTLLGWHAGTAAATRMEMAFSTRNLQTENILSNQVDSWPTERINGLTKTEVQNLRSNALARGNHAVVERCDQVLNAGAAARSSRVESRFRNSEHAAKWMSCSVGRG